MQNISISEVVDDKVLEKNVNNKNDKYISNIDNFEKEIEQNVLIAEDEQNLNEQLEREIKDDKSHKNDL